MRTFLRGWVILFALIVVGEVIWAVSLVAVYWLGLRLEWW